MADFAAAYAERFGPAYRERYGLPIPPSAGERAHSLIQDAPARHRLVAPSLPDDEMISTPDPQACHTDPVSTNPREKAQ